MWRHWRDCGLAVLMAKASYHIADGEAAVPPQLKKLHVIEPEY
jgi:hypothetical protein